MKKIYLIRHGKTKGNLEKRYIGRTDENLCKEGILELQGKMGQYPDAELVFASPMKRCMETAELLYQGKETIQISQLCECDFGIFENKNYEQLKDNPDYQRWIDSGGTGDIPEGEGVKQFKQRCCSAFEEIIEIMDEKRVDTAVVIAHGGTFMAILEAYGPEKKGFYDWRIENGDFLELVLKDKQIIKVNR